MVAALLGGLAWACGIGCQARDEPGTGEEPPFVPLEVEESAESEEAEIPTALPVDAMLPSPEPPNRRPLPSRGVADFEREAEELVERSLEAGGLGAACLTTADCQLGLGCADVLYSGAAQPHIAGGYCSRWCEEDSTCEALEEGARCTVEASGSDLNFCVKGCLTGAEDKCGGRHDVACGGNVVPDVEASCFPRCSSNADCAVWSRCSAAHGFCEAPPLVSDAEVGERCDPTASRPCNGGCSSGDGSAGVCWGRCRLGSTCGAGPGTVCAPTHFGLREGDYGNCEQICESSSDCEPGLTACAPTGFVLPSGEPRLGCVQSHEEPTSLVSRRLSVEEMQEVGLFSDVVSVSADTIFQAVSHRLFVEDGAVCASGEVVGNFGGLLEIDFQLAGNGAPALDASGRNAFSFDAEGHEYVRFDVFAEEESYRYAPSPQDLLVDVPQGAQQIGFEQLLSGNRVPLSSQAAARLRNVRFTLLFSEAEPGPFRYCVRDFALVVGEREGSDAGVPPDASAG